MKFSRWEVASEVTGGDEGAGDGEEGVEGKSSSVGITAAAGDGRCTEMHMHGTLNGRNDVDLDVGLGILGRGRLGVEGP